MFGEQLQMFSFLRAYQQRSEYYEPYAYTSCTKWPPYSYYPIMDDYVIGQRVYICDDYG